MLLTDNPLKNHRLIVDDNLTMAPTLYVAAGVSVWL